MATTSVAMTVPTAPVVQAQKRFRILVCVDGTDESYRALRYAARLGKGNDADLVVLNVRPPEEAGRLGQFKDFSDKSLLEWGLEIPGVRHLRKARDLLFELHALEAEGWDEEFAHVDVRGDDLGDNKVVYENGVGKRVVLQLKVADDVSAGILEHWDEDPYDIIIVGAPRKEQSIAKSVWDPSVAGRLVWRAPCSILVASAIEEGHGHLICLDGSEKAIEAARRDAVVASRCKCPISLISVAPDEASLAQAREHVEHVVGILNGLGIPVIEKLTPIGTPAEEIIRAGQNFSVIVMADPAKRGLRRLVGGSVAQDVLADAHHSVMIAR